MTRTKYFVILLVFLVLGGGGYWYFKVYRPQQLSKAYRQAYRQAHTSHDAGDFGKSIPGFEAALRLAPTVSAATQTKLKIAFDIFFRNKGNDRIQAVDMYKQIIDDQQVSRFQRAIAISDLLDLYNGTHDESFARNVIFAGPFASYIQNGDVELAARKLYEYADELYPLALVELRIANWYSSQLNNTNNLSNSEKEDYLLEVIKWTEKGGRVLPVNLASIPYEKSKIGYIYQMLGLARRTIAKNGNKDYSASEEAFKKGLEVLATEDTVHTYDLSLYLKFHYAAMLAETFRDERKNDISKFVKDIIAPPPAKYAGYPFGFYEFLKNETGSEHDEHGHKKDIIRLKSMVPEFAEYLQKKGLNF